MTGQSRFDFERVNQANFERYHAENPHIYQAVLRFSLELKRHGRQRLGMKAVFERLRWWSSVEAKHDSFSLNNNWTAFYSRLVMELEPELAGFFEIRTSKHDRH